MARFRIEIPSRNVVAAPPSLGWAMIARWLEAGAELVVEKRLDADVWVATGDAPEDCITDLMLLARGEW